MFVLGRHSGFLVFPLLPESQAVLTLRSAHSFPKHFNGSGKFVVSAATKSARIWNTVRAYPQLATCLDFCGCPAALSKDGEQRRNRTRSMITPNSPKTLHCCFPTNPTQEAEAHQGIEQHLNQRHWPHSLCPHWLPPDGLDIGNAMGATPSGSEGALGSTPAVPEVRRRLH